MSDSQLLSEISRKLDRIIGLYAIQGKNKEDQIRILVSLGFSNQEIGSLTGIPKGSVDRIRAKQKKNKSQQRLEE
jgi:hypothetical protein